MQKINIVFSAFIIVLGITGSSFAVEKFYSNIDCDFEFRAIAIKGSDLANEKIPNSKGEFKLVEKKVRINSSDVLGISTDENQISIHFNRASWSKVREVSLSFQKRKIALVKNNKIIFTAPIVFTIDRTAKLSTTQKMDMNLFLEGFSQEEKPAFLSSRVIYIQFLKSWLNDHPNDGEALRDLAFEYVPENDLSQCKDAIPYLEKIFEDVPNDMISGLKIINCYLEIKNNTQALKAAKTLLPNLSDDIMKYSLIGAIGEIYYRLGMHKEAIQQVEIALNYYKTAKGPGMADWENYPVDLKEQAKKQFDLQKREAILIYEKTLNKYKNELTEKEYQNREM